jgi:arylsulfatase A-like enzyme
MQIFRNARARRCSAAFVATWAMALAPAHGSDAEAPPPAALNVLLISIDTLRADHLGAYGYTRETSPRLDALAGEATRYADVLAPTPWTLPSHAGLLTGRHPWELGMRDRFATVPTEVPIVAEYFTAAGYESAAFVDETSKGWVGAERGFGRGFETYRHLPDENGDRRDDAVRTADAVISWLERRDPSRPFFLFAHTKSVHSVHAKDETAGPFAYPYRKPRRYLERFASDDDLALSWRHPDFGVGGNYLRRLNESIAAGRTDRSAIDPERLRVLRALYDAGIYYVDEQIGRIVDALERLDLREQTILVVTSDHGEAFLEHQLLLHKELYDQLLRVPLIVSVPGRAPAVSREPITLMDVTPMLLDLAGLERPPLLASRDRTERFTYYRDREAYYAESYSLRDDDWVLVWHRLGGKDEPFTTELYRSGDVGQERRIGDQPERATEMLGRLQQIVRRPPRLTGAPIEVDERTLEHLRALGYVD